MLFELTRRIKKNSLSMKPTWKVCFELHPTVQFNPEVLQIYWNATLQWRYALFKRKHSAESTKKQVEAWANASLVCVGKQKMADKRDARALQPTLWARYRFL